MAGFVPLRYTRNSATEMDSNTAILFFFRLGLHVNELIMASHLNKMELGASVAGCYKSRPFSR